MPGQARGFRNQNPGNIRKSPEQWRGMSSAQPDPAFVTFIAPVYGIRAIVKILISYQARGLHTIRQMINAWAPPVENDTGAYVEDVSREVGSSPDQIVSVQNRDLCARMVAAIIRHECGSQPYGVNVIQDAMTLAGIS